MFLRINDVAVRMFRVHRKGCQFPTSWAGQWFQLGLDKPVININSSFIETKGECSQSDREKFLVFDKKDKCYRCIVMYEKHTNVLQYKETFCEYEKSLDALCSNINGDAPLFSMFRVGARPVTCPFKNPPFSVVYNKGHGDCGAKDGEPPSKAESCTDDTRLVFKFQACPDVPGTEAAVEELECLGTWKDSAMHYLVGRLHHKIATTDEERYRCFVYHKPENHFYEVAQSGEATCSGMVSPVEGSRTFKLTRVTAHNRCKFPQWVTQHTHWRSLDYSHSFHFSHKNASLRITSRTGDSKTEIKLACHQIIAERKHSMARVVVHVVSGCDNGYRCMTFYRRDNHVIQMQQSVQYNDPNEANSCANDEPSSTNTITMITAGLPVSRCPLEGRYAPMPGLTPSEDTQAPPLEECRQHTTLQSLSVGCSQERDNMEFQSNCRNIPATSYSCHGSWRDNTTTYVVGSPVSRHSADSRHYCFIFTHLVGGRGLMLQRVAETCTVASMPVEWMFNITEIGKCSETSNAHILPSTRSSVLIVAPLLVVLASSGR
ncbi:Hypothetical protein NTJ_07401 [Nesidiocoris tenuis]|uniref:Uncharacterized protein n=1 Tax=Nesidiocoris tenuis TaxID=355587 RepID=A0ABN7ATC3_9HEMI|nr:Hypothetical protein NTJ_07401 [Nesidiocoris tenuis]